MKKTNFILLLILFMPFLAFSQLSVTTVDTENIIDFDNTVVGVNEDVFVGTGFMSIPVAGQLDADGWEITGISDGDKDFGVEDTDGDCARGASTGGESSGGVYAFQYNGTTMLGVQASGTDFTPGAITLKVDNNTGVTVNSFDVEYNVYMLNDQNRSSSISLSWSLDNVTFIEGDGNMFSTIAVLEDPTDWIDYHRIIRSNLTVLDGESIYIRWTYDDKGGENSRDELAFDDITITLYETTYTDCSPISTFPWEEDFESYSNLSELRDVCWQLKYGYIADESLLYDNEDANYFYFSSFANAGDNAVAVNLYDTDAFDWLITPSFDLGDGTTNYMLEFDIALTDYYAASQGSFEEDDYFAIVISTDGGNTWSDLNVIDAIDSDNDDVPAAGTHYLTDLTGYTGVVKFAFYGESTLDGPEGYDIEVFIDNMSISELSGCVQPFGAGAYVVDATSVFVDWEDLLEGSNTYNIEYGVTGFTQGAGTLVEDVAVTEYLVEGLTYETYDVYIQADCGGGDTSEWIMITFTLAEGGSCATAFEYGAINDPAISSSLVSLEEVWYYVLLDAEYDNVMFSLCDSDFDTYIKVFSDCETSIGENDDSDYGTCSTTSGAMLFYSSLPAGVYYVRVTGYDYSAYGDFTLEITSDVTMPNLMASGDTFYESNDNDGTIVTEITITLGDEEFTNVGASLVAGTDYNIYTGPPAGLTLDVYVNSTTEVILTLTGIADAHTSADNSYLELAFTNSAFVGDDASVVLDNYFGFDIMYTDEALVVDLTVIEPSPGYACGFTDTEQVPYEIENVGTATLASGTMIDFSMKSGGMVLFTESLTLTSDLMPTETFAGFTTNTVDLSVIGATYYKAYVDYAPDTNQDNDTLNGWIVSLEQTVTFPADDDMNDTIVVGAYPYTIMPEVTYNPDSAALVPDWEWVAGPMTADYAVSADGWYYVYCSTFGCETYDSVYVRMITSVTDLENNFSLDVYPNPTSDIFTLDISADNSGEINVFILSVDGKIIENRNLSYNGRLTEQFDVSSYAPGMYIVRIDNKGVVTNRRLIKN